MAESFSADWLALREPVDHRSRPLELLPPLLGWWVERGAARVVDLGSGTGSNLRYLGPRLGVGQRWRLVDHDAALLARAERSRGQIDGVASLETVRGDLAAEGIAAVADAELVTASALLDLVSRPWLDALVDACLAARCAALFALTWDGELRFEPADRDDAFVADAVREHQRRDKGLGAALGPTGCDEARRRFEGAGWRTTVASSPWVLGPDERELALSLLRGFEQAAIEQRPEAEARVRAWAERQRASVRSDFRLVVGHADLLALPPG